MKKLSRILSLFAVAAALFTAGCSKTEYKFYTNIPLGKYSVIDDDFTLGESIDGYSGGTAGGEFNSPVGYTAKTQYYFSMFADAQLIVSDDFSTQEAVDRFAEFSKEVAETLDKINKSLSSSESGSDIYNFNRYDAGIEFAISKITYEVLACALEVHSMTDGYYNPALYYNIQAYGFGGSYDFPESSADLPDDNVISKYTELAAHFSDIRLREEGGKYYVKKPDFTVYAGDEKLSMKLDLGGIGKGYAVDCIDALFGEYGYEYGLFNFGASSMLIKSNVQEGNYTLELTNPRSSKRDGYLRVPARNEKVSTSGDNEQRYFLDGVRYCHIIDPTTGKPVQTGIMSATVIGGGAAEDDALTTAIMCMGKEKAIKFIEEKLTDRRVVFTVDG